MQNIPKGRINLDGGVADGKVVGFVDGVDSYSQPMMVKPTQARWLENAVTRGAIIETRPGFKTRFSFTMATGSLFRQWWDSVGNPTLTAQMMQYFRSSTGQDQLIFAVSGSVWCATINPDGSLQTPFLISAADFYPYAPQLVGCSCVQTSTIMSGQYVNNITPRNLLIIQDGVNRACSWDGSSWQKFNPTKRVTTDTLGNTLFPAGYNETITGLWMAWSGNRLWVAQGNLGRASDLGDPTHFTEEMYQTSGGAWSFPARITAMIDRGISGTTNSQLIVTTRDTVWAMATGVQNRLPNSYGSGWVNTPNFQTKMFSAVGCVAGKSMIVHRGLLYWMSQDGIVVFDSSGTVFSTQNLPPIDQEMSYSKRQMAGDLSTACAGYRDSYVFWGVPVGPVMGGRPCNGHIQVLDRQTTVVHTLGLNGPFTYGTIGWQGVWTGIRPVEWATPDVNGTIRPYALSMDQDGTIRIWEGFQGNRADNGKPVPWQFETRQHPAAKTMFETSLFRHARVIIDQMLGNVTMQISWKGMRGIYHETLSSTFLTATPGGILAPTSAGQTFDNNSGGESYTVQNRDIVTPDLRGVDDKCQSAGVESPFYDNRDRAFSLLFQMTGRAAIIGYRIAVDEATDENEGDANPMSETGFHILPENDCPSFVDGATPTYNFADENPRDAFAPTVQRSPEPALYAAPSS